MKQCRVVFDTNVIISGFLFGGHPKALINLAIQGVIRSYLSTAILDEVRGVLLRPKFGLSRDQVMAFVEELSDLCEVVLPEVTVDDVKADPDDNMILECALAADADIIASGDAHLLDIKVWRGIRILAPATVLKAVS